MGPEMVRMQRPAQYNKNCHLAKMAQIGKTLFFHKWVKIYKFNKNSKELFQRLKMMKKLVYDFEILII